MSLVALFTPDGKKIGEVDSEQSTLRDQRLSRRSQRWPAHI